jgi:2-iminobutanoate/2-iminopropanoate deaminase
MNRQSVNPPELGPAPRFYSHAVTIAAPAKLVYVSGQISLGPDGKAIGAGDLRRQCEQVFENVTTVLRASGAAWGDVIKMNAYMVGMTDENVAVFRDVRAKYLIPGQRPASTFVGVARLVQPELLLEVEVIAALSSPI